MDETLPQHSVQSGDLIWSTVVYFIARNVH
jgi:hypothetical protein